MRNIMVVAASTVVLLFAQCDETDNKEWTLGIDVQSDYSGEHVTVLIDQEKVIDDPLTTNHVLGVTPARITTSQVEGVHTVKIIINNDPPFTKQIELEGNLYLGVNYEPSTGSVSITESDLPFLYD
jgi:hypothetical protein